MKRILSFALCLLLMIGCGTVTASAAQNSGVTVSLETAIYSISNETFVRTLPEPASQDECGPDEYVTVHLTIKNTSGEAVTLHNFCISIDGGKKLYWADPTLEAGKTATRHVFYVNAEHLAPGLHTAVVYASDKAIYSGRFSIGRAWSEIFKFPTEEQIKARPDDKRSPYLSGWFSIGSDVRYDAYCIDFKSDHIPGGTYNSLFNGYLDFSSLEEQYESAGNNGHISLYGGLQRGEGIDNNFILSFWDIYCTDADGKTTIIRPKRTYPVDKTDNDSFGNEGEGAHTQLPYDWQAGRWYRMLLQCGTSETTGNTTVEQWFQDLTTGEWTHTVTYDIGVKDSAFVGYAAIFSENFLKQYAGGVRSLEVANVRIHTTADDQWRDVTSLSSIKSQVDTTGVLADIYGSWEAGADGNSFYMISTGVSGWGRTEETGKLTVKNRESGNPLKEAVHFTDVADGDYYADAVAWAVKESITSGTSETTFSPNDTCTVGQILTFLWRASGSPEPTIKNPFSNIKESDYYYKALLWAKEKGIISATAEGTFGANAPCTRGSAVFFMWGAAGSEIDQGAMEKQLFDDVPLEKQSTYVQPVYWAVKNGITSGTSATTFSPEAVCTRAQIMTFLYRAFAK